MIKPKMDLAKALGMMGFGSARIEDHSGKRNALDELNNALSRQMENMEERKKKIEKTEKVEQRREAQHDKLRDEIRTMHEAYQFLAAKYRNDKARNLEKASDKKSTGEVTDVIRTVNDKEDTNDEVFAMGMGAVLSTQSTPSMFIDKIARKSEDKDDANETKDENNLSGSITQQVSQN